MEVEAPAVPLVESLPALAFVDVEVVEHHVDVAGRPARRHRLHVPLDVLCRTVLVPSVESSTGPHRAYLFDLPLEPPPVVTLGNSPPDPLDLLDEQRARLTVEVRRENAPRGRV